MFGVSINNQPYSAALEQARMLMDDNNWSGNRLRLQTFARKLNDGWWNVLTVVRPIEANEEMIESLKSLIYPDFCALVYDLSLDDLNKIIEELNEKGLLSIGGIELHAKIDPKRWQLTRYPGGNLYDSRACLVCSVPTEQQYGLPTEELLSYEHPFFQNPSNLVIERTRFKNLNRDSCMNCILIIVPDTRAYFSDIKTSETGLTVCVDGLIARNGELKIKGEVSSKDLMLKIDTIVDNYESIISFPNSINGLKLWLIDSNDYIYDEYSEPLHWMNPHRNFNVTDLSGVSRLGKVVLEALQTGETEIVEYKPYIKRNDKKMQEIIRTVLSFLNTNGGVILLGITDNAEVVGVESEALKDTERMESASAAIDEYTTYLKQAINREIPGPHSIEYDVFEHAGKKLIVIQVTKGAAPPYLSESRRDIYVRRGANNVRASREDLRRIFGPTSLAETLGYPRNQIIGGGLD